MNDSLIPYAIVTAIATMVGALGSLGVSKLMSSGLKSSTKKLFVGLLSGVQWPFRLGAAAIKEWRRVSVYRHRPITWDDLPQKSKGQCEVTRSQQRCSCFNKTG